MINDFESEVVEFKEAKSNYSFNDNGKYFSALSNEANIRGFQEAWLVFGIFDDKKYVGTEFTIKVPDSNHVTEHACMRRHMAIGRASSYEQVG